MNDITPGGIQDVPLADALGQRYLAYALSTIVSRSLPDVRDGLKPVHRRLLYAMRELGLNPDAGFKKCARVVGDVIGKFHPHGDTAVYDALVRLAQDFAVRWPLVDGQGNFGNVDGDNAAAMRYTEARLTTVAELLLEGIDEDAVDFRPTYDGEDSEPAVLPARFPNLLANGASGIAVGMATSIPTHNVAEICQALRHLIKHPNAGVETLVGFIRGPDFPTGGVLVEPPAAIAEAYATGRGSFRLRARWEVERKSHGQWQVVVTEIPYQVQKSRLIEKIADLLGARKLPLLADVRDESTETVRIVLEPKSRSADPAHLMEPLFRQSDLETRVGLNMNVLDGGLIPRVMTLREVLQAFLDHRHEVLVRRSRHRLAKIERRLEILDGLRVVYLNLDEVIRIVREEDHPKRALMDRFDITDVQATAILDMRLRQLRKLEELEIRKEHDRLSAERAELGALLADEGRRWKAISDDIAEVGKIFGPQTPLGRRRTSFAEAPDVPEVPPEALVEREPVTVLCSEKGWIRAAKGHDVDATELNYKSGDAYLHAARGRSNQLACALDSTGRSYSMPAHELPSARSNGEPLTGRFSPPAGSSFRGVAIGDPADRVLLTTTAGYGFVTKLENLHTRQKAGKQLLTVPDGYDVLPPAPVTEDEEAVIICATSAGHLLACYLEELPELSKGKGNKLINIPPKARKAGEVMAGAIALVKGQDCLVWSGQRYLRLSWSDSENYWGERAQRGGLLPRGYRKVDRLTLAE